ncbi:(d)CMP kinase [Carboxylicivirga sediminis]|uniref:Cytidylate kinase n=1 Tax=Carboxylicivirga sediminis TaxID=2006564 RepID=A0A941F6W6_9BACT|nr:(d)CMP kinase [Carboxylicivirga sediminis]MBR8537098.1 (d)CMP kinase [Carboxylicivirga sediminis]
MMHNKQSIIAIDGHSSCGKSTVAKDLAKELGYVYIDTGAMYRSVTLFAMQNGLIQNGNTDEATLKERLGEINISFKYQPEEKKNEAFLNGVSVEDEIRSLEVSNNVSAISAIGFVRKKLVELQQEMGKEGGIVMDGRDIGTVVFPNADLKLFMTASPEIRAQRRYDELTAKGDMVEFDAILENVKQRDYLDSTREESPLIQAEDAVVLDNSQLNKEEQLEWIIKVLKDRNLL